MLRSFDHALAHKGRKSVLSWCWWCTLIPMPFSFTRFPWVNLGCKEASQHFRAIPAVTDQAVTFSRRISHESVRLPRGVNNRGTISSSHAVAACSYTCDLVAACSCHDPKAANGWALMSQMDIRHQYNVIWYKAVNTVLHIGSQSEFPWQDPQQGGCRMIIKSASGIEGHDWIFDR